MFFYFTLRHKGRSSVGIIPPGRRQDSLGLVVTGQSADTALHQDKPELGVFVLAVPLQVLADGHGLLDQIIDILGKVRSQAFGLEDSQNLVTRHKANRMFKSLM